MKILRPLIRSLRRIGIKVEPFLIVLEDRNARDSMPSGEPFACRRLTRDDIPKLLRLESVEEREIEHRLEAGMICFVIEDAGKIVAKMWCDLAEFNYPPAYRRLGEKEAYLFGAVTDSDYRGKGLAPLLRTYCYRELRAIGIDTFWSYTGYFNMAARNFKSKLGASDQSLRLHIEAYGHETTLTLRTYLEASAGTSSPMIP